MVNEYGGLKGDQVKRLLSWRLRTAAPRRAVSDPTLDKPILTEAAKGNFCFLPLMRMRIKIRAWHLRDGRADILVSITVTQRKLPTTPDDEGTDRRHHRTGRQYGRYGIADHGDATERRVDGEQEAR